MKPDSSIDVKVIYSSSSRPSSHPVKIGLSSNKTTSIRVLAIINLLVSGALYYGTWWEVDPFLYMTLIMKTPVDLDQAAAAMFGFQPTKSKPSSTEQNPATKQYSQWSEKTKQIVIPFMSYSWLTLATVSSGLLAMLSGSLIGQSKKMNKLYAGVTLMILVIFITVIWFRYGMRYHPNHLRTGMAGLILLCLATGLTLASRTTGLARFSSIGLIVAACYSVLSIIFGYYCGAIDADYFTIPFITMVFIIHSGWGWMLFFLTKMKRILV